MTLGRNIQNGENKLIWSKRVASTLCSFPLEIKERMRNVSCFINLFHANN